MRRVLTLIRTLTPALCLCLAACGRAEPDPSAHPDPLAREETMPTQAVAMSTAAALAEVPPNERPDEARPPRVSPASFDCARAAPGVEVVICTQPDLAALDREMTRLYHQAEREGPGDSLRTVQRGWLKSRNACAGAGSPTDCLMGAYAGRIYELKTAYAAAQAPGGLSRGPQIWTCDDDTMLRLLFIDTYKPVLWLDASAGQVLLSRSPSASGARYAGGGYEVWLKDQALSYSRPDTAVIGCHLSS